MSVLQLGEDPVHVETAPREVVVTDIKMPIGSMVDFLLKLCVAAIPAALVVAFVSVLIGFVILNVARALKVTG